MQRIDVNVRTVYRQLQFSSVRCYLTVQLTLRHSFAQRTLAHVLKRVVLKFSLHSACSTRIVTCRLNSTKQHYDYIICVSCKISLFLFQFCVFLFCIFCVPGRTRPEQTVLPGGPKTAQVTSLRERSQQNVGQSPSQFWYSVRCHILQYFCRKLHKYMA